jgi:hypothetical protein
MDKKELGRNDPCHCGSGRKYKVCCLDKDEAKERAARAKLAEEAPAPSSEPAHHTPAAAPKRDTRQPWRRGQANTRGFQKVSLPRKVGS